jgi:hypothetical protein
MQMNKIEINGIEGQKSTFYPNTQVVVRAYPKENEEFHAWQITGDITLTEDELISNPIVFSMPNADIAIDAIFRESREFREDRYVTIFKNIEDAGTARAIDGKIYKKYDDVTLEAIPVTGYSFFRWTSNNLLIEDDTNPNYTFAMPGKNVDIQAFFRPLNYLVTTIDDDNGITKGAGYYEYRSNVYVKPVPNSEQYVFDYWEVDGIEIENKYIEKLVFKMPHNPVTVKAIFKPFTFNVKIVDRTFLTTVEYDSVEIARTEVAISAIAQREHYGFNNWYSDDVIFNDANSIDTTFLMPERDIVIYYSYGQNTRILSFDEFEYGDATGDGSVPSGSNAIIEAIPQNYVDFLGWRIVSGGPLDDFDKEERLSSFTMPDRDVILAPTFRPITFAVSVSTQREMFDKEVLRQAKLSSNRDALSATGGSIETVKSSYRPEEDVILFAQAHPGFKFKQWEITYNNNTVINNDPDLAFKMPPYEVEIVGIFKEYIDPMTWTQNLSAIQLGSIFQLAVDTYSTGKVTFRSLNESVALIGGPNKDQIFIYRDQDVYVEASIEADDFFEHKSLVRKISPISPASYVVKLHDSRIKYDHNDLLIGGPVEPSYGTVSGSSPTGRMLYIDLVSVVEGVEFESWDIDTGINTLFYWYGRALPPDVPNFGEVKFYSDYQRYIETSNGSGALSMSIIMPPNEVHVRPIMNNRQIINWDQIFTGINLGDAEIQLFAESNRLLEISYRLEECSDIAYISSGKLFFSNVGKCQITAYNEGDGFYDPAFFVKDITVYSDQTITWDQDLSSIGTDELPLNLTASSSMGLNITYSCSDPSINISGSQILFVPTPPLGGTTVEITASQSGTEFIREADPVTIEATFIDKLTDTDGDGIPDWQDNWPHQENEDIIWDQDLTSINSANPITLTATAPTSGRTITYKLSNDTLGSISGSTFTPFSDVAPPTKLFLTITASAEATQGYKASTITKTLSLLDTDGDGYPDFNDDFPENANEWKDSDGDGVGDNQDAYPLDPSKTKFEEEITWDQDLSQIVTRQITLTATSKTGRIVSYSLSDDNIGTITGNILELNSGIPFVNNLQVDITAEVLEDSRNLGASITKNLVAIDSDGDGVLDFEDQYPGQATDSIEFTELGDFLLNDLEEFKAYNVSPPETIQSPLLSRNSERKNAWESGFAGNPADFHENIYMIGNLATSTSGRRVNFEFVQGDDCMGVRRYSQSWAQAVYDYGLVIGSKKDDFLGGSTDADPENCPEIILRAYIDEDEDYKKVSVDRVLKVKQKESVTIQLEDTESGETFQIQQDDHGDGSSPAYLYGADRFTTPILHRHRSYKITALLGSGRQKDVGILDEDSYRRSWLTKYEFPGNIYVNNGELLIQSEDEVNKKHVYLTIEGDDNYATSYIALVTYFEYVEGFVDTFDVNGTFELSVPDREFGQSEEKLYKHGDKVYIILKPNEGYQHRDSIDTISVGYDSNYSNLSTNPDLNSVYNLQKDSNGLWFYVQHIPFRVSQGVAPVFEVSRYEITALVSTNGSSPRYNPIVSFSAPADPSRTDYEDNEVVTVSIELGERRSLNNDPIFKYQKKSHITFNNDIETLVYSDVTSSVSAEPQVITYTFNIKGDTSVTFDIEQEESRGLLIHDDEFTDYLNFSATVNYAVSHMAGFSSSEQEWDYRVSPKVFANNIEQQTLTHGSDLGKGVTEFEVWANDEIEVHMPKLYVGHIKPKLRFQSARINTSSWQGERIKPEDYPELIFTDSDGNVVAEDDYKWDPQIHIKTTPDGRIVPYTVYRFKMPNAHISVSHEASLTCAEYKKIFNETHYLCDYVKFPQNKANEGEYLVASWLLRTAYNLAEHQNRQYNHFHRNIATGSEHTLFLTETGQVFACGKNQYGQLGSSESWLTPTPVTTPVRVEFDAPIVSIAAGRHHSLALDLYGNVWAWGRNNYLQLGLGADIETSWTPKKIDLSGVKGMVMQIECGWNHNVILTKESDNVSDYEDIFPSVSYQGFAHIDAWYVDGLNTNSSSENWQRNRDHPHYAYTWGANNRGQLGIGNRDNKQTPQAVLGRNRINDNRDRKIADALWISAGGDTTMIGVPLNYAYRPILNPTSGPAGGTTIDHVKGGVLAAGKNYCWAGASFDDALTALPVCDENGETIQNLDYGLASDDHCVFMLNDYWWSGEKTVLTSGKNEYGQLGHNNYTDYSSIGYWPRPMAGIGDGSTDYNGDLIQDISVGPGTTYVWTRSGTPYYSSNAFKNQNASHEESYTHYKMFGCGNNDVGQIPLSNNYIGVSSYNKLQYILADETEARKDSNKWVIQNTVFKSKVLFLNYHVESGYSDILKQGYREGKFADRRKIIAVGDNQNGLMGDKNLPTSILNTTQSLGISTDIVMPTSEGTYKFFT